MQPSLQAHRSRPTLALGRVDLSGVKAVRPEALAQGPDAGQLLLIRGDGAPQAGLQADDRLIVEAAAMPKVMAMMAEITAMGNGGNADYVANTDNVQAKT